MTLVDDFHWEDWAAFLDVLIVLVVIDKERRARIPGEAFLREVGLELGARCTCECGAIVNLTHEREEGLGKKNLP